MKLYLPLGTVVLLKDGVKKLVITDRLQRRTDNNCLYDYAAHLYPEGGVNKKVYLFNEEDIETIVHRGYSDAEEEAFVAYLNEVNT